MSATKKRVGALTFGTIALLAAFFGVDAVAHFTKGRQGETFSAMIQAAQRAHPLLRVAVTGALVYLIGHLELGWPML